MSMILPRAELIEIAGLARQSAVARWLDGQGISYLRGADGWPRVLRSVIVERLGGKVAPIVAEPRLRLRHG